MTSAQDYFPRLAEFPHAELFAGTRHVWEVLPRLQGYVREKALDPGAPEADAEDLRGLRVEDGMISSEGLFTAKRRFRIGRAELLIEAGARMEPGVVIFGPAVLCEKADFRPGAYLRGGCLIGPGAVVGHATEVKNSVFLNRAVAGHFAYVGDSLLGMGSNLGAGTKLANLQLRTEEEKRSRSGRNILIRVGRETVDTGLRKFGAVVGDDVEIGCNTVTSPGTLLGPGCWVVPNTTVPKGVHPPAHLILTPSRRPVAKPRRRPSVSP
ncbi:MAG: hypothetical protein ABII00_10120 [Elusimicrobiota bacterium]